MSNRRSGEGNIVLGGNAGGVHKICHMVPACIVLRDTPTKNYYGLPSPPSTPSASTGTVCVPLIVDGWTVDDETVAVDDGWMDALIASWFLWRGIIRLIGQEKSGFFLFSSLVSLLSSLHFTLDTLSTLPTLHFIHSLFTPNLRHSTLTINAHHAIT